MALNGMCSDNVVKDWLVILAATNFPPCKQPTLAYDFLSETSFALFGSIDGIYTTITSLDGPLSLYIVRKPRQECIAPTGCLLFVHVLQATYPIPDTVRDNHLDIPRMDWYKYSDVGVDRKFVDKWEGQEKIQLCRQINRIIKTRSHKCITHWLYFSHTQGLRNFAIHLTGARKIQTISMNVKPQH